MLRRLNIAIQYIPSPQETKVAAALLRTLVWSKLHRVPPYPCRKASGTPSPSDAKAAKKQLPVLRRLRTICRFWESLNPDNQFRILGVARTHGSLKYQGLPHIAYRPGEPRTMAASFFGPAHLGCLDWKWDCCVCVPESSLLCIRQIKSLESVRVLTLKETFCHRLPCTFVLSRRCQLGHPERRA